MSLSFSSRLLCLTTLGLALSFLRCSSSDPRSAGGGDGTGGRGGSEQLGGDFVLDLGGGGSPSTSDGFLHPLCQVGSAADCMPDDPFACEFSEMNGYGGLGGLGGMGGLGGDVGDGAGGTGGGPGMGTGGDGVGGTGADPGGGLAGAAGAPGTGGGQSVSDLACHLVSQGSSVVRSCEPTGTGGLDAPCLSPANCAPGYTCVGTGASGLCRPYCCLGDHASCSLGTYCAPRSVVGPSDDLLAPVCVRADQCKLSDEYPCPVGASCQCVEGTACVPVRSDGTTSCVVPGTGTKGDPCDGPFSCSYGYVCSQSRGCLQLCSTVSTRSQCDEGEFCQALAGFPDDAGVCVAR